MLKLSAHLKNKKGMALIEVIPLVVALMVFFTFAIGFFGIVHSGILQSISTRNYAFETFRHRSDLTYLRNTNDPNPQYKSLGYLTAYGYRLHYTIDENAVTAAGSAERIVAGRPIALFREVASAGNDVNTHLKQVETIQNNQRNAGVAVSPVWIRTNYGICLNSRCDGT